MKIKKFCPFCGNSLTTKYHEGRNRLFCPDCDQPVYENPVPATAAVVMNHQHEILLVKRNVEPSVGEWCLPGGFVELEEPPEAGCLRELKEETNLDGEIYQWAGNVLSESPIYKSVLVMGYFIRKTTGELKAGDDCSEARFFKPGNMPPIAFSSHREILRNALKTSVGTKRISLDLNDPGCLGAYVITSGDHIALAQKACEAGAKILQYREKHKSRKELLQTALAIANITRQYETLFIVNDYIDVALIADADGVHLGQDDIPISEARKITPPGFIIGRSTHSLEQAVEAEKQDADYIGSGPIFATPTKEDYIPIGIDTLSKVVDTVHIPVVAIGGLNLENIPLIRKVGAKNFAMVRAFQKNTGNVIRKINE
ncbi:MAG: thiamine phosphate synthase [bacterium]|nr:thiamine phosphate synthase [bacterium]